MAEIKDKKEYLELVKEAVRHDRLYYEKNRPIISDYEYDQIIKRLEEFEKKHPHLVAKDSPTKRVEEGHIKGFKRKKHRFPMLSLSNTYSKKEVEDFVKRVKKLSKKDKILFCLELKIDGTAVAIKYEKGILVQALTRGDGKIGDDITNNIKTIKSLPLKLNKAPDILEIKAEVFMNRDKFKALNKKREDSGISLFANPRNAAAGSLKLLDKKEVEKRDLQIICYGAYLSKITSQFKIHSYLSGLKLPAANEYIAQAEDVDQIMKFADKILSLREKLSFEIDGIVIKVDDLDLFEKLGTTGKSPRAAIAYKFAPERAFSKIKDITIQVGRTGVLTPVAELEPTFLAGSTISRATLHNIDEIKRKDIRVGDHVIIEKGGDVIPKIVSVDMKKRKNFPVWTPPKKCPVCGSDVEKKEGEVAIRCVNKGCYGKKLRKFAFFVSKKAMDIDSLGEKIIKKLLDKGMISKPSDIYLLRLENLYEIEGFKEKAASNIIKSIERSKKCSFAKFIMALEIKYVGEGTAELLANFAKDLKGFLKLNKEDLVGIEGIGDKVADSVIDFLKDKTNIDEIDRLIKNGVTISYKKRSREFLDKVFVLTGTLSKYKREEAFSLIRERGGKISNAVGKSTDFLIVGENPGSKYEKAKALKIKTLTEKEFVNML